MDMDHFDYPAEWKAFIAIKPSRRTQGAYNRSLLVFEQWFKDRSLALADITPDLAADFIRDLRTVGRRGSSGPGRPLTANAIRAIITACSSFYSFLEGRFPDKIRNPFRGASDVWHTPVQEEKRHRY
jgi:site-specific recombinase XerD